METDGVLQRNGADQPQTPEKEIESQKPQKVHSRDFYAVTDTPLLYSWSFA